MRRIVSSVLTLAFLASVALAIPAFWVRNNIVDEQGFSRLFSSGGVQQQSIGKVVSSSLQEDITNSALPDFAKDLLSTTVTSSVTSVLQTPAFDEGFNKLLQNSHQQIVSEHAKSLDVTPLLKSVQNNIPGLAQAKIPVETSIPLPQSVQNASQTATNAAGWATPLMVLAGIFGLGVLIVGRNKGGAIMRLAGVLGAAVLLNFSVFLAFKSVAVDFSAMGQWAPLMHAAMQQISTSFNEFLRNLGVAAAVAFVIGFVLRLVTPRFR